MFDLSKPINISLIVTLVTSFIAMAVLYLSKPSWIQRLNNKGKAVIFYPLFISYALTFGIASGIAAFLLSSKGKTGNINPNKPPSSSFPTLADARAFAES